MGSVTNETELGKKLQLARKRAGLTQQQLCQKAGLSYSTLAKIERGAIRSPSVFTVASIASATSTPLEDLLDLDTQSGGSPAPPNAKKRSKTGIRFVYFDIDGVLIRFVMHAFPKIARDHGLQPDVVENAFWRHNDSVCRGDISLEEFNSVVGQELGISGFSWLKYYFESAEPTPGAIDFLKWAAQHYDVGLISNHMPGETEELFKRQIIPELDFKTVVDSCKVGAVKPEAKIYETATELAAATPPEILLIDDNRTNLTAADRAGWQISWFDQFQPAESIERAKAQLEF
ncbi:HAD-IA family hydrolase [Candidatus Saccharibacteria bacterium]|nr:HAD-IA family hydrolase [Candidatus Saccharibacteria bacterium]